MSAAASALMTRLAEIVGEANLIATAFGLAGYAIGVLPPSVAVRPGSADEVAEVVKFAAAEKIGVVACGARTKLDIGLPPRKYDLALDVSRLDRVIAYDPDDLTLSVEAGIPLHKLGAVLGERQQFLPLAVPFLNRTTIGGTVASAMDSPLRQFYGTPRDFILGMEFVTGDGTLAKSGGRVVKNVTGYDLHKLMIGSYGTLAIITKINFRTFPLPRQTRAFVANFDSAERALDLRERVSQSPLKPLTIEIFSPSVADLFYSDAAGQIESNPLPPNLLTRSTWAFTCGFAGTDKVLDRCEAEMRVMAEQMGAGEFLSVSNAAEIRAAFGRKREFVPIALESPPATTVIKASILPSRMAEILNAIESSASGESIRCAVMARAVGVIYVALLPGARTDEVRERVARTARQIQVECEKAGGNATIPWCPPEWKSTLNIWGPARGDFAQMRKLKSVFDPHEILSPGRFVGGI
jgi:glycolate oxidase FAD binding subunit